MTTIAYKNGLIAADTKASNGGVWSANRTKIARNTKGDLIGCSGEVQWCANLLIWFIGGEKGKMPILLPKGDGHPATGLIIRAKERNIAWEFYSDGALPPFSLAVGPAGGFALGSGQDHAYGAMVVGADAIAAVKAGILLDSGSGGDIHALGHEGPPRIIKGPF